MKRILYFLPSILVLAFLAFILLALGNPSTDPQEYLAGAGILLIFLSPIFSCSGNCGLAVFLEHSWEHM